MNIIYISLSGLCFCVLIVLLKKSSPIFGQIMGVTASLFLVCAIFPYIKETLDSVRDFAQYSEGVSRFLKPVIKITGISYIASLSSELCKDAGENALASHIETAGKILICALTVPLAREAFIKITGIIK